MYENDTIVRNARPFGANSIEIRLMICMASREYEFRILKEPNLDLKKFIIDYCNDAFRPTDKEKFEMIVNVEIENTIKLSMISPDGDLTPRGIFFIELNTQGAYIYIPRRHDLLFQNYLNALQMPTETYFFKQKEEELPLPALEDDKEKALEDLHNSIEEDLPSTTHYEDGSDGSKKEGFLSKIYKRNKKNTDNGV